MYTLMAIQGLLLLYSAAIISRKHMVEQILDHELGEIFFWIPCGIWGLCTIISSLLGKHLRKHPLFSVVLLGLLNLSQIALMTFLGHSEERRYIIILTSVMVVCCTLSLSFYSCLLKRQFTRLYSHIIATLFMVIGSLISGIVLYSSIIYWEMLTAVLSAQLWVLFVIFNTVAILPKVTAYEGFYAALAV